MGASLSANCQLGDAATGVGEPDVDLVLAKVRDVRDVRDHEQLVKAVAEGAQLVDEAAPTLLVLASEDLVENDKPYLHASLARDPVGDRQAKAQVGEILLTA